MQGKSPLPPSEVHGKNMFLTLTKICKLQLPFAARSTHNSIPKIFRLLCNNINFLRNKFCETFMILARKANDNLFR